MKIGHSSALEKPVAWQVLRESPAVVEFRHEYEKHSRQRHGNR